MEIRIRPIHDEADYDAALAEVDGLMGAVAGTPEGDRLDVLVTLIEAYEARYWRIDLPDPIDAIRVRMEQNQLRPRDLEPMIGSRGRVSEVLSRKRALTLPMIRRLSAGLDLRPEVLIQESSRPRSRRSTRKPSAPAKKMPRPGATARDQGAMQPVPSTATYHCHEAGSISPLRIVIE